MKTIGEYAFATLKVLTLVGIAFTLGAKIGSDKWQREHAEMAAIAVNAQRSAIRSMRDTIAWQQEAKAYRKANEKWAQAFAKIEAEQREAGEP